MNLVCANLHLSLFAFARNHTLVPLGQTRKWQVEKGFRTCYGSADKYLYWCSSIKPTQHTYTHTHGIMELNYGNIMRMYIPCDTAPIVLRAVKLVPVVAPKSSKTTHSNWTINCLVVVIVLQLQKTKRKEGCWGVFSSLNIYRAVSTHKLLFPALSVIIITMNAETVEHECAILVREMKVGWLNVFLLFCVQYSRLIVYCLLYRFSRAILCQFLRITHFRTLSSN